MLDALDGYICWVCKERLKRTIQGEMKAITIEIKLLYMLLDWKGKKEMKGKSSKEIRNASSNKSQSTD